MAAANLGFELAARRLFASSSAAVKYHAYAQILCDIVSLTMLAHFSGGVQNPFLLHLVFHNSYARVQSPNHQLEGTVTLSLDVTERRHQEEQILEQNKRLRETQEQMRTSREDLARATEKISELIDSAARDQSFDTRYANPHLVACWKVQSCPNTECPCHGREAMRC